MSLAREDGGSGFSGDRWSGFSKENILGPILAIFFGGLSSGLTKPTPNFTYSIV